MVRQQGRLTLQAPPYSIKTVSAEAQFPSCHDLRPGDMHPVKKEPLPGFVSRGCVLAVSGCLNERLTSRAYRHPAPTRTINSIRSTIGDHSACLAINSSQEPAEGLGPQAAREKRGAAHAEGRLSTLAPAELQHVSPFGDFMGTCGCCARQAC